jgi:peptidoglycan/xylan/chitin deacetylase (PgdA/CDA1 family)
MTILCYHAVQPGWDAPISVIPRAFEEQMAWLAAHRTVVDLTAAVAAMDAKGRLPSGTAALTFDDGFASVHEHALPVLRRHALPATVFLVAETLTPAGRTVDWVDRPPPDGPPETLTIDQLHEMAEAGVRFGSHGFSHRRLPDLADHELEEDLRRSREVLAEVLGEASPFLAYPRGLHDGRVRRAAERAGFTHAFGLPERREQAGPYAVPRVGIYHGNDVRTMRIKLARWYLPARTSEAHRLVCRAIGRGGSPASTA